MTNYEVIIRRGEDEPVKVVLDNHDAGQAEARYEELRGVIEEGQRVNAPAVDLAVLGPAGQGLVVDPAVVTAVDLADADEDPSPV